MMSDVASGPGPIKSLPFAQGRAFVCLDDYLAHLRERAGPIGQPWYREVAPGLYERITTRRPPNPEERVTRASLLERYGFIS